MFIHTFLTDGLVGWGKVFLKSFKLHHGEKYKIVMSARNLSDKQIKKLKKNYSNIIIHNKELDIRQIAKDMNTSVDTILNWKYQVEKDETNTNNYLWKIRIAFIERYINDLPWIMEQYKDEDFMVHADVDSYWRGNFDPIFEELQKHDISVKFRTKNDENKKSKDNRKTLINLMSFKNTEETRSFVKDGWGSYVKRPYNKIKKGYGQAALWYAYCDYKDEFDWYDMRRLKNELGYKYQATTVGNKNVMMWTGNKGSASKTLKKCNKDMNE